MRALSRKHLEDQFMAQPSKAHKDTVGRVMHEYKHGELRTEAKGPKVKDRKQAIAIALHEAGESKYETPQKNRENLRHTKAKERRGETVKDETEGKGKSRSGSSSGEKSKAQLYSEAKRRDIPGRSKMSKPQLERVLSK
jgi:hypothetical protein